MFFQKSYPFFLFFRTTFTEFSTKHAKDPRFRGIDKLKEKEGLFNEFMIEFRKAQREKSKLKEEKVRVLVSIRVHTCREWSDRGGRDL